MSPSVIIHTHPDETPRRCSYSPAEELALPGKASSWTHRCHPSCLIRPFTWRYLSCQGVVTSCLGAPFECSYFRDFNRICRKLTERGQNVFVRRGALAAGDGFQLDPSVPSLSEAVPPRAYPEYSRANSYPWSPFPPRRARPGPGQLCPSVPPLLLGRESESESGSERARERREKIYRLRVFRPRTATPPPWGTPLCLAIF